MAFNQQAFGSQAPAKRFTKNYAGEVTPLKPKKRLDGELYKRPEPNPFSGDWCDGYDDGLEGRGRSAALREKPADYADGFACGEMEREELDRMGSSN